MQEILTTNYGYSIRLSSPFAEGVEKVKAAFFAEGFGALSEINVKEKMKEKLEKEMAEYVILGMCNPTLAYQALEMEKEIGLLLPCNVIVYADGDHLVVAAQQPRFIVQFTGNVALQPMADEAEAKMKKALQSLIA